MAPFLLGLGWGLAGVAPAALGVREPLALVTWIAVLAPAAGFHGGARGLRAWPYGLLAPAVWMIGVAWLDAVAGGVLPTPAWAALSWTGIYAAAFALGAFLPRAPLRGAALLFLGASLLCALPTALPGESLGERSPRLAALAFDLSPAVLLAETAGIDYMRHGSVYRAAGTEWFSDRRAPHRGKLAGPLLLLVGCSALFASRRLAAGGRAPE